MLFLHIFYISKLENLIYIEKLSYSDYIDLNKNNNSYDIAHLINNGYTLFFVLIGSFGCCQTHLLSSIDPIKTGYYGQIPSQVGISCISLNNNKIVAVKTESSTAGEINLHGIIAIKA